MIFRLRKEKEEEHSPDLSLRVRALVRDAWDGVGGGAIGQGGGEPDVMAVLIGLRAAARRGSEFGDAERLGPQFSRYLSDFYSLPSELQPLIIETLLASCRREAEGDLVSAVTVCEGALASAPDYLPLLERLAELERARGEVAAAERYYVRVLIELDRRELEDRAADICRELLRTGCSDATLLLEISHRLEAVGDVEGAARCYEQRARKQLAAQRPSDALIEVDQALGLLPDDAVLHLVLAEIYEQLEELDRAASAYDRAEALAVSEPATLAKIILMRARIGRTEDAPLARLLNMLESRDEARTEVLATCAEAVLANPYNAHLQYLNGVLLAQDGQEVAAIDHLRTAAERYASQSDGDSELESRLALQQVDTRDETNRRRIAELYFERGEVRLAMQALAGLARSARRGGGE